MRSLLDRNEVNSHVSNGVSLPCDANRSIPNSKRLFSTAQGTNEWWKNEEKESARDIITIAFDWIWPVKSKRNPPDAMKINEIRNVCRMDHNPTVYLMFFLLCLFTSLFSLLVRVCVWSNLFSIFDCARILWFEYGHLTSCLIRKYLLKMLLKETESRWLNGCIHLFDFSSKWTQFK